MSYLNASNAIKEDIFLNSFLVLGNPERQKLSYTPVRR